MTSTLTKTLLAFTVLCALVFGALIATPPEQAHASTKDSDYSFTMSYEGTAATAGRAKANNSSTYVKVRSFTKPCRMYVDGAKRSSGGNWTNCTVRGYAYINRTGPGRIMNNVNEWGYLYARLTAWANTSKTTVTGAWSPDCSTNSYRVLNAS